MKACPECRGCLEGLARLTAGAACPADADLRRRVEAGGVALVRESFRAGHTVPPRLATEFQREIRRACGVRDPFERRKGEEFAAGRRAAALLAPDPGASLGTVLRHSVLGNQLDFFRPLDEVAALWGGAGPELGAGAVEAFSDRLSGARAVLVLTDNAGELPFDLPLLSHLAARGLRVRCAVKGGPSQNDATRADVHRFGLELPGLVDTGTDAVGCELSAAGGELLQAWDEADVVLAKGMANYETLSEYPEALAAKAVHFLLVAKCPPVAASLGVAVGTAVLARGGEGAR